MADQPIIIESKGDNSSMGLFMGILVVALIAALVFFYGLPYLRQAQTRAPQDINVQVPEKIDVNVNRE